MSVFRSATALINRIALPRRVMFVSWALLVMAAIGLFLCFATSTDRQTPFGPQLGADYANFYIAGTILNSGSPERLYDLPLQAALYHEILPQSPPDRVLPYPYAPFFAAFLRPFALLPYQWSYGAWLICGLLAYVLGFFLVWKANPELEKENASRGLLIAVSFMPFLFDGWIGGQSVGITVLIVGAALYLMSRGHETAGGLVLSICLFKPTLLVLLVPMLVIRRRIRACAGLLGGTGLMCGLSWLVVGGTGLADYARLLKVFATLRTTSPEVFRTWKYVDLTSWLRLLAPHETTLLQVVPVALSVAAFAALLAVWWPRGRTRPAVEKLCWASALAWTPVLTPQCGIYDVTLLVPGMVLMFAALESRDPTDAGGSRETLRALAVLLYVIAAVTQPVAMATGVQVVTIVLVGIGLYLLQLAWRLSSDAST